ncbi:hypothetical protein KP509_35G069600 [Ceratopteris richardii]|nr:hypothetical protein KP509_35G069600 [Ceratopteris richardii]
MSGNRVTDTNTVTEKSSVKHDSNDIGTEVPGMDRRSPLRKEEQDSDLLRKQLGEPPEKPLPGDCCGSGCVRCVWDIYFEELDDYNSRKAALNGQRDSS